MAYVTQRLPHNNLIYLASPYSHDDKGMMHYRYTQAREAVNLLLSQKKWVYSPIVHNHLLTDLGRDWDYWAEYDLTLLDRCDELYVLTLPGWDISKGVHHEMMFAREKGITVTYMDPVIVPNLTMPIARSPWNGT